MSLEMFKSFAKGYDKKEMTNKRVWIYTRVSSKDQESNKSLKNQSYAANQLAEIRKFIVSNTFGGTYESASGDFTRKEFTKLINAIREAKEKPYAILLNTISRFSRTGGGAIALAYELVEKLGVQIIEVSTGKSTETEDGKLEIYRGLIHAKQENIDRLRITIPGMKKFLQEGNWLGRVPRGYDHYGPRVKEGKYNKEQKITLDSEGKILRQAWQWKLQGERDYVIQNRLTDMGLKKITKQLLSQMWRNPFYCGISSHKMLDGELVYGNWEKMVSEEEFLIVQEILKGNRQGYKQDKSNPDRPLNSFIHCADCGGKLAGYEVKKRKRHYYKCQICTEISINADYSAKFKLNGAHELFIDLLERHTLKTSLIPLYRTQLKYTYETLNKERIVESEALKKELERTKEKLNSINMRYLTDPDLDKDLYKTVKAEFESKIHNLTMQIAKLDGSISNIDTYINASEKIAQNISKYWVSEGLETKRRVQDLVFKGKLSLDVKNRSYLTHETNLIFAVSAGLSGYSEGINDERQPISKLPSSLVAGE